MTNGDIASHLRKIVGIDDLERVNLFYANVDSVDKFKRTCDVTVVHNMLEIPGVMLMSACGDGELKIPAIGSTVIIGWSDDKVMPFVHMWSDIDEIIWITGRTSITMKKGQIQFNDGQLGGLVNVQDLVTRLNNVEDDINNLKNAFNSWVVTSGDGGAKLYAAATTWFSKKLVKTKQADIENKTITHGKGK